MVERASVRLRLVVTRDGLCWPHTGQEVIMKNARILLFVGDEVSRGNDRPSRRQP
jgi:hypothetical protein